MEQSQSMSVSLVSVSFNASQLATFKQGLRELKAFIHSELRKDVDYGVIPGCPKPSLFKPGAEKLAGLFSLASRTEELVREMDFDKGWVFFSHKTTITSLATGRDIASCDGSANSKEKKFAKQEPASILNTIQKMSQKRSYVGAVILATRASDFFTHDVEDIDLEPAKAPPRNVTPPKESFSPSQPRMATPSQAKMIWARLKKDLNLNDLTAREMIKFYTGKEHSADLTHDDIQTMVKEIDKQVSSRT